MMELAAEVLMRKADELLSEKKGFKDAIYLCRAAATLYRNNGQLNLAVAALMKISLGLQENHDFYREVIEVYEEVATLYEQDGNQEGCSTSLMSAAFVAQKAQDSSLAIKLFLQAGQGYQNVAEAYWQQGQYQFAWDNIQLSCRCWKNVLNNAGILLP